jgi:hypothetical protein
MGNDGHARGARILLYGLRSLNTSYIRKADLHYDEIGILNRCFFGRFGPGRGFNCLITEATHIEGSVERDSS